MEWMCFAIYQFEYYSTEYCFICSERHCLPLTRPEQFGLFRSIGNFLFYFIGCRMLYSKSVVGCLRRWITETDRYGHESWHMPRRRKESKEREATELFKDTLKGTIKTFIQNDSLHQQQHAIQIIQRQFIQTKDINKRRTVFLFYPIWKMILLTIFAFHSNIKCMQFVIGCVNRYAWLTSSFRCGWWMCFSMVNFYLTAGTLWIIRKGHKNSDSIQWCSYFPVSQSAYSTNMVHLDRYRSLTVYACCHWILSTKRRTFSYGSGTSSW